jgi:septal ring factor EnvC (AmiA/AmiB activator)
VFSSALTSFEVLIFASMSELQDDRAELKATQSKLETLAARQLELKKQHEKQLHERAKHATWYERLVGQPPLREDPEVTQTITISLPP